MKTKIYLSLILLSLVFNDSYSQLVYERADIQSIKEISDYKNSPFYKKSIHFELNNVSYLVSYEEGFSGVKPLVQRNINLYKFDGGVWSKGNPNSLLTTVSNGRFTIEFRDFLVSSGGKASIYYLDINNVLLTMNYREFIDGELYSYPVFILFQKINNSTNLNYNIFFPNRVNRRYSTSILNGGKNKYIIKMSDSNNVIYEIDGGFVQIVDQAKQQEFRF